MPVTRTRNIYNPRSKTPFKLSRSKLEEFLRCQRCFYIDRRLGVSQPSGYPFNLNSAVDALLKKEFDIHRAKKTKHPLMESYGINAVPYDHPDLDTWRENFTGVQYHETKTNLIIFGAVDDVWVDAEGKLIVVDYKATSKDGEVTIDAPWQDGYKRQMEIYQWLLRQNEFNVADTGYFVYCNGKRDRKAFDKKLEFDVVVLPYTGDDSWVSKAVTDAHACLEGDTIPEANNTCEFCEYRSAAREFET